MTSENLPIQANPFEHLGTHSFELPPYNDLTSEQRDAIFNGPGWVHRPVELLDFDDISSFRCHEEGDNEQWGSNNFKLFFSKGFAGDQMREHMTVFKRFDILYPEVVERLSDQMEACNFHPTDEVWNELLVAYKLMRVLVDKNDRFVTKENGEVETRILTM